MSEDQETRVAIVDYGRGNLFSVQRACEHACMTGVITSKRQEILNADVVILPGVGAFGDAMDALHKLDLVSVLQDIASMGKSLIGICLGMQLLMSESNEFGTHKGLGIIPGEVVRFSYRSDTNARIKVPHVGWNQISHRGSSQNPWKETPLRGLDHGEYMYFVHSFYAKPQSEELALSVTHYGGTQFCSSLVKDNVFACQFHPERSGIQGLRIYETIATMS